ATPQIKITRCPPGDSSGLHRDTVFSIGRLPVSATFDEHGEASSTGIAFDDFAKMHSVTITVGWTRRYETPNWVLNPKRCEEVFLKYCDKRVHRNTAHITDRKRRLAEIAKLWLAAALERERILDKLCNEYVEEKRNGIIRRRI